MMTLIENQEQLDNLAKQFDTLIEQGGVIAVDTEFLREKTYAAQLCLMQLGIDGIEYCVDVLAIDDLSSLSKLMTADSVLKLFHAARQDMEVLYQTLGVLPKPIFDTQLAAAFCGSDMQQGYSAMVLERLQIELGHSQARTDWSKRPLSESQLSYAAEDVRYLHELYHQVKQELDQSGKSDWYRQEIAAYYDLGLYVINPKQAYKRLAGGNFKIPQQYLLGALAEWREATAQKRNIPRNWVVRDDKLYELVNARPHNEEQIRALGIFGKRSVKYFAAQVLEVMREAEIGSAPLWRRADPLNKQQKSQVSQLMKRLAALAEKHSVAQALLGTRKDVEHLYRHGESGKLLHGWRKSVVGEPLAIEVQAQQALNA